jgi:hypothetical protein
MQYIERKIERQQKVAWSACKEFIRFVKGVILQ